MQRTSEAFLISGHSNFVIDGKITAVESLPKFRTCLHLSSATPKEFGG